MNAIRRIRRLAAVLAGLAAGLVAFATPAFARVPHPSQLGAAAATSVPVPAQAAVRTVTHTVVVGGMPGWQIALIAAGAALLAAALAVLLDRRGRGTAISAA